MVGEVVFDMAEATLYDGKAKLKPIYAQWWKPRLSEAFGSTPSR